MAVVHAVKSSVSNVKLLAQKTAELPELIEDACRRQLDRPDLSKMRLHRELGSIEDILMMEPPKEVPDEQIWQAFTEGVLGNLKFLDKEVCCVISIGACAMATVLFTILEASGQIQVDATYFLVLVLWFLISLLGAFIIKMIGLVLFDAFTWDLVYKMNEKLRKADEKRTIFLHYSVSGWINAERVLQIWGPAPREPTLAAHFVNFGSAALAYAMPIPKPGTHGVEALPPPKPNEVELITNAIDSYEVGEAVYSELLTVNGFSFRLAVYPQGLHAKFPCVAAFVEAEAPKDDEWCYRGVKFQVTVINCIDYRVSIGRIDQGDFHDVHMDRGWADLLPQELATEHRGWVSSSGSLVIRAACSGPLGRRPERPAAAPWASPAPPTVYGKAVASQGGSIESLVSDLKTSPEDADVQRSSARALYDLCVGKDATALRHKQQAAEAGALEALVAAMKAHHADARVQSWAACPVASICSGDDEAAAQRKHQAVEAGALEAMVAATTAHRDEAKVQVWAACMVDRICQGSDVATLDRKQQAVEVGWLEALVAAMKAHADDEDVQFHSAKALHNICSSDSVRWKQQAAKAGAIEALVAAMVAHREDVKVQGWAAGALCSLCSAEDAAGAKLKHQVFKVGGLEVLSAALQLEDVRCRTWSASAGLRICCGEEAAKKHRQHAMEVGFTTSFVSHGVLSALAAAVHSDDVELRGCGAWALWKAWEVMEDEMPQRAVEAGVLEALVSALNSRDAELQRPCVNVLYSICVGEDAAALERKQRAAQAGSLEALVDAMKHSQDADLQRDAACALGNLCSGADDLAQQRMLLAAEASAVLVLREALTFCEGDEELSEAIKELIRRIEEVLKKVRREEDGASTVAFLESPIPAERQHVQLEVDDEPAVPEEPIAAVPFAITTSLALPSVETQPHYTPSIPSSQLREGLGSGGLGGLSITGPVPVMTPNNCFEPQYVPMPAFAEDVSELPV